MAETKIYKLISLVGVVCFPNMPINCDIRKKSSQSSIESAVNMSESIVFATQTKTDPTISLVESINPVACLVQITNIYETDRVLKVEAEGIKRVVIKRVYQEGEFAFCEAEEVEEIDKNTATTSLLMSTAKQNFVEYSSFDKKFNPELMRLMDGMDSAGKFCDAVAVLCFKEEKKQLAILNELDVTQRLEKVISYLIEEIEIARINIELSKKVNKSMDKNQRDYYLREQMKAISEELGENDASEFDEIEKQIIEGKMPQDVKDKALKELARVKKLPNSSPDYSVLRNYLDTLLGLPWGEKTTDNKDLKKAREILDAEHAGLEKVKDRIVEYLAVMHLTDKIGGQIICFAGPPGVGKTSIAKSIAKALGRNFVKMSVGGVKDESEIRGHRKTYVGAMPGRIIYNMKLAGSTNPVFLIDEIDKMSSDYRGDPTSAMLEVLDPEQNTVFRDNFLEVPFDLSDVLFIATANNIGDIPSPLLDRMEVIELSSYTTNEKFKIAKEHLLPKLVASHGLKPEQIEITDNAIKKVIEEYTFESGVRGLERTLATICRKVAVKVVTQTAQNTTIIDENDVFEYLGAHKIIRDSKRLQPDVGLVSGLSYSTVGGGVLTIEVNTVAGDGKIIMTGRLGDVMQESAKAALSAVMGKANQFGLDAELFRKKDIHIHVPEGAIKKDGPSAGCALATAIYSAFSNKKVDNNVAMTGEITIRGNVLAIGGLKEKLFACVRTGIEKVLVPEQNKQDVLDLPKEITENLNIVYVSTLDEVLANSIID